jgi:hypothetical protein
MISEPGKNKTEELTTRSTRPQPLLSTIKKADKMVTKPVMVRTKLKKY